MPTPSGDPGTLSKAAQPNPTPYYGYVNFGAGSGLNLDGNWFGIGGVFSAGDFPTTYTAPSTTCPPNTVTSASCTPNTPSATPASYIDIGGFWQHIGGGNFITLKVSAPTTTLTPFVPAHLTVTAMLNDGNGDSVLDGTQVNLFLLNWIRPLGNSPRSATMAGGTASATINVVPPLNLAGHRIPLAVVATAPNRGVADDVADVSEKVF